MNNLLPVVILAGGLATRLHPMTETIPKALIPINNDPFIVHQLRLLHMQGIQHVVICVGFLGNMIKEIVGDGHQFGLDVTYSYDGSKLLGTGGAIKQALSQLNDAFFVLYGDSFLTCSYLQVQKSFECSKKAGLMAVLHNEGKWDTSNIEFNDGQILVYDKKNRTNHMHHVDYGLGILSKDAFLNTPNTESFDLEIIYQNLLHNNQLAAHEVKERFYEIGSFDGINELEYYLSHKELPPALCI